MSNVIYLGRIPEGFVEKDIMKYFAQFGHLKRLKLYRSKKTGRSKGFAFMEFASAEVAKVVASTMNNYLMFEKILKCHVVAKEKVHARMFQSWQKLPNPAARIRKIVAKANGPKGDKQHERMLRRLARKIAQQNKKLEEFGINYSYPITWSKEIPEVHVREELSDIDQNGSEGDAQETANDSKALSSEYSLLIDSSDDEVGFKTPDNCVKKSKNQKTLNKKRNLSGKMRKVKKLDSKMSQNNGVVVKSILKRVKVD